MFLNVLYIYNTEILSFTAIGQRVKLIIEKKNFTFEWEDKDADDPYCCHLTQIVSILVEKS